MNLEPDFSDFIEALARNKVEFVIVGAFALAYHGAPRATRDFDVWVRPELSNAKAVLRALAEFGTTLTDVTEDDILTGKVIQLGVEPIRIDILSHLWMGVHFSSMNRWNFQRFHSTILVDQKDFAFMPYFPPFSPRKVDVSYKGCHQCGIVEALKVNSTCFIGTFFHKIHTFSAARGNSFSVRMGGTISRNTTRLEKRRFSTP